MAARSTAPEDLVGVAPPGERVRSSTPVVLLAIRGGRLAELILQRALRPVGLDGSQLAVLYALGQTGPGHALVHGELCRLLAQTPSGVTRTVRRLEAQGLVERLADPADGRATVVALTAEGHLRAEAGVAGMLAAFEQVMEASGLDDVTDLVAPLARLVGILDTDRQDEADVRPAVAYGRKPDPAAVSVGELIRTARTARGLSQRALAVRLGVGAPHLSKVETGKERPGQALLVRTARELGLDPDELVLRAGFLPGWAEEAAAVDPATVLGALRRGATGAAH